MDSATTEAVSRRKPVKRLTQLDVGWLIKAHKDGMSQNAIAERLGCSQKAVWQWIQNTTDSTDTAKSYLRGSALRMAQNIVSKGRAADHVAALKGLSVLEESQHSGLVVQIGIKAQDVQVSIGQTFASEAQTVTHGLHSLTVETGSDNS